MESGLGLCDLQKAGLRQNRHFVVQNQELESEKKLISN